MRLQNYWPLFIIFILVQSPCFAKPDDVVDGLKATEIEAKSPEDRTIEKILSKVQGARTQYELCLKKYASTKETMSNCLWNGDNDTKDKINPLSDDDKKQIKDIFTQEVTLKPVENGSTRSPANSGGGADLTLKSKQIGIDNTNDPAINELKKVFEKKLNEALYGDEQEQKSSKSSSQVDHKKFNDIYKTALGKTIVDAFTSYCLDVDFSTYAFDINKMPHEATSSTSKNPPKYYFLLAVVDVKVNRQKNIDQLKKAGVDSSNGSIWSKCITSVQNVCYDKDNLSLFTTDKDGNEVAKNININPASRKKACIIVDYVKSARKNLTIVEETDKMYKELESKNAKTNVGLENIDGKAGSLSAKSSKSASAKNLDEVIAVTTKDIKDSYEKETKTLVKDVEKCVDKDGNVQDPDYCKKFINTNTNDLNKNFAEYSLRQYAQEDALKEKLDSNKSEVEKYLQEEGYSKEKAQEMVKDKNALEEVKKEIAERYKREREALISDMAVKIQGKTTAKDNKVDVKEDKVNLASIRSDFASRPEDLKQLVFFNNVVSSFLTTQTKCDKSSSGCKADATGRNVAAFYQEMENSAFLDANDKKALTESATKAGLKKEQDQNKNKNGSELSIEDINKILKYSSEK